MWRKYNTFTLCVATMHNYIEVSQKIKTDLPSNSAIPRLGIYLEKIKILNQKRHMHPFINYSIYHNQDMEATYLTWPWIDE